MIDRGWRYAGWGVTVAAVSVYVFMVTVTLPHLMALAGGAPIFDMGLGYDLETATAILTSVGDEGRAYYSRVQHLFDSFYPPLFGLALAYWFWRAAPRWRNAGLPLPRLVLGALIGIAFLAAAFDLTENALVERMLIVGPDGLTAQLVGTASAFTVAKSVAVSIALIALLILGTGPFFARSRQRREG